MARVRRPRTSLWALRIVITVLLLAVLAQPVLAGLFLTGDIDAISVHGLFGELLALGRARHDRSGRGLRAGWARHAVDTAGVRAAVPGRSGSRSARATRASSSCTSRSGSRSSTRRCCWPGWVWSPLAARSRGPHDRATTLPSRLPRHPRRRRRTHGALRLQPRLCHGLDRGAVGEPGAVARTVPGAAAGAADRAAGRRPPERCRSLPRDAARRRGGDPPRTRTPILGLRRDLPRPDVRDAPRPPGRRAAPQRVARADGRAPARRAHPGRLDGWPLDLMLPVGDSSDWSGHGMVGDPAAKQAAGVRELPLPDRPAGGDALVPRPPHGLHRAAGLPRARRLPLDPRRRGGRAARCPAASGTCR